MPMFIAMRHLLSIARASMVGPRTRLLAICMVAVAFGLLASGAPAVAIPSDATPGATPAVVEETPVPDLVGDGPIAISASAAFGGTFKVGEWLPIDVILENRGPDTAVDVQATTGSGGTAATYVVPVDLPAGTRKAVTLYTLPDMLPRTFEVVVVDAVDRQPIVAADVRINPLFQTDPLCGTIGYPDGALGALGRVRMAGASMPGGPVADLSINVAPIDMATFPTVPEALYSFNCIVVGGSEASTPLSQQAQAALAIWVERGGQLIVAGGERWQSAVASVPAPLLPLTIDRSETVADLAPLAEIVGTAPPVQAAVVALGVRQPSPATGEAASVLAGSDDVPLVIEHRVGNGRVTMLTFDPAAAPIVEWDGADDLWSALLLPPEASAQSMGLPPEINPRTFETAPLVGALSQIAALDLPSITLIAGLLAAYLLVVSPINYLVLRRLNRLSWAWATTIVLVGVFAVATYGLGARIRGSDVIVNTISIVQRDSTATGPATARTYVGLFSPSKSSYEVDVGSETTDPVLLSQMPPSADPWSSSGTGGGGTVVQGSPAQVRDLGVSQWASRYFMAEHHPASAPALQGDLRIVGGVLRGTVTNSGSVTLRDCVVFVGTNTFRVGDILPGASEPVELDLSTIKANPNGFPLSQILLGFDPNGGWPDLSQDRELRMRQMILDTMYGYGMTGPITVDGINAIAWAETTLLPIAIRDQRVSTADTVLLTTRLSAALAPSDDGTITIPPGLIAPVLAASDAESTIVTGNDIQVYGGSAEFDLPLPLEARLTTVSRLTLHLPLNAQMAPVPASVELFDVESGQFVALDTFTGTISIEEPQRYVDTARGTVRMRVTAGGMNPGIMQVHVSLDGTMDGTEASQ